MTPGTHENVNFIPDFLHSAVKFINESRFIAFFEMHGLTGADMERCGIKF